MTALPCIIVHGGAGAIAAERRARVQAGLRAAAEAGHAVLAAGGAALDAVCAAVRVLEDDPEFNAGTGSALTRDGTVETDASVMDGATRRVGAVAAVPDLGCAVRLARAVLDAGEHAILAGPAAWRFAADAHTGIAPAAPGALITERARERLRLALLDGRCRSPTGSAAEWRCGSIERDGGTVGAVARDASGRFAAATSTGGISGKRAGRVGDSPIPGAGTWADDGVALSATGDGEAILRVALAHAIAMRVAAGESLHAAATAMLAELARITGGVAGVIGVARDGHAIVHLSPDMPAYAIGG